jgi:hypothetical protein
VGRRGAVNEAKLRAKIAELREELQECDSLLRAEERRSYLRELRLREYNGNLSHENADLRRALVMCHNGNVSPETKDRRKKLYLASVELAKIGHETPALSSAKGAARWWRMEARRERARREPAQEALP